ncbi:uncharacterized protein A4U43_C05F27600 [Asparagus officinalis]|uniref:Uncharacterized protein n=1 Tax=Asparagus officinalis TaxID=4686 RepID=A0A5P1EV28_ASPOF|nr:uncharacterized protein A4U43_C05F27600 [Asparagus officinalis]
MEKVKALTVLFLLCCFAIIAISSACTTHNDILDGAVACRQLEADDVLVRKRRSARGYVTAEAPPTPVRHWMPKPRHWMPKPDLPPREPVPPPPLRLNF